MENLIRIAGIVQLAIAAAKAFLPRRLRYRENLARVSPIVRQVFIVHSFYLVFIVTSLAGLCLFFPRELTGASMLGKSMGAFLALFWLGRLIVQLLYYDPGVKRQFRLANVAFIVAVAYLAAVFVGASASPFV